MKFTGRAQGVRGARRENKKRRKKGPAGSGPIGSVPSGEIPLIPDWFLVFMQGAADPSAPSYLQQSTQPAVSYGRTLKESSKIVRAWIEHSGVGGTSYMAGNSGWVRDDSGYVVAYISYNGRVWYADHTDSEITGAPLQMSPDKFRGWLKEQREQVGILMYRFVYWNPGNGKEVRVEVSAYPDDERLVQRVYEGGKLIDSAELGHNYKEAVDAALSFTFRGAQAAGVSGPDQVRVYVRTNDGRMEEERSPYRKKNPYDPDPGVTLTAAQQQLLLHIYHNLQPASQLRAEHGADFDALIVSRLVDESSGLANLTYTGQQAAEQLRGRRRPNMMGDTKDVPAAHRGLVFGEKHIPRFKTDAYMWVSYDDIKPGWLFMLPDEVIEPRPELGDLTSGEFSGGIGIYGGMWRPDTQYRLRVKTKTGSKPWGAYSRIYGTRSDSRKDVPVHAIILVQKKRKKDPWRAVTEKGTVALKPRLKRLARTKPKVMHRFKWQQPGVRAHHPDLGEVIIEEPRGSYMMVGVRTPDGQLQWVDSNRLSPVQSSTQERRENPGLAILNPLPPKLQAFAREQQLEGEELEEFNKAIARYCLFHGVKAEDIEIEQVGETDGDQVKFLVGIGATEDVSYSANHKQSYQNSNKRGVPFRHEFPSKPHMATTPDGDMILIINRANGKQFVVSDWMRG